MKNYYYYHYEQINNTEKTKINYNNEKKLSFTSKFLSSSSLKIKKWDKKSVQYSNVRRTNNNINKKIDTQREMKIE